MNITFQTPGGHVVSSEVDSFAALLTWAQTMAEGTIVQAPNGAFRVAKKGKLEGIARGNTE